MLKRVRRLEVVPEVDDGVGTGNDNTQELSAVRWWRMGRLDWTADVSEERRSRRSCAEGASCAIQEKAAGLAPVMND